MLTMLTECFWVFGNLYSLDSAQAKGKRKSLRKSGVLHLLTDHHKMTTK